MEVLLIFPLPEQFPYEEMEFTTNDEFENGTS